MSSPESDPVALAVSAAFAALGGPDLAELAAAHGVATSYADQLDRPVQVRPESVVAVLGALGVDASSAAAVRASLDEVRARDPMPPVVVLRESERRAVPVGGTLRLESGEERACSSVVAGLPTGWHELHADDGRVVPVVVAPDRVALPAGRQWGWQAQLYAVPSRASWAMGDLADLRRLATWTAARGGGLVLVNPLHAVAPVHPVQPSPYYPASRRWTNPLYLRVEETPAYAAAPASVRAAVDALRPPPLAGTGRIDRDAVWSAKKAALEMLWPQVASAMHARLDRIEPALRDFATWCALAEVYGPDWRAWPAAYRRPQAQAVASARGELADRVAFHAWLQQLCDEQLAGAQAAAAAAGMPVGIVHDLAVGTDPAGADAWAWQDALALGARIGAPPDTFNQQGQDWGMPPWHPRRLAEAGYAPLRELLRGLLRHAGGLRIDHILGLFRLWWVPEDGTARDGTYVRYNANALLGVVALEAARAGAVVIGEDLGTVPPEVREALGERGVLGSSVLWFERELPTDGVAGPLVPPARWRAEAVTSVTTHDLPTALGWLRGEHVRVRAELGLLDDVEAEWAAWRRERAELVAWLVAAGLVAAADPAEDELVAAMHLVLTRTPSRVVLAGLGDAVGDVRQPNLPGTVDEYPNWRLPVAAASGEPLLLDELLADERVERLAAMLANGIR